MFITTFSTITTATQMYPKPNLFASTEPLTLTTMTMFSLLAWLKMFGASERKSWITQKCHSQVVMIHLKTQEIDTTAKTLKTNHLVFQRKIQRLNGLLPTAPTMVRADKSQLRQQVEQPSNLPLSKSNRNKPKKSNGDQTTPIWSSWRNSATG